jgi:hypothetical protein
MPPAPVVPGTTSAGVVNSAAGATGTGRANPPIASTIAKQAIAIVTWIP